MLFMLNELSASLAPFAPTLASWVRDGKPHQALARQTSQQEPKWATTCKQMKQLGAQQIIEIVRRWVLLPVGGIVFAEPDIAVPNDETEHAAA